MSEPGTVQPIDDETLNALAEKSGDTVEHIKSMLNVNETGQLPSEDSEVNTLLAGKYKTEEDLDNGIYSLIEKYGKENAYKILEKQIGKPAQPEEETNQNPDPTKDALTGDQPPPAEEKKAGIDFEKYNAEFTESGQLSEDSYKELEEAGIPKAFVDNYIKGLEVQAQTWTTKVYDKAGGQQTYETMVKWAETNLTAAEKQNFNNAVQSGDEAQASLMVDALKARYERANGTMKRNALQPKESVDNSSGHGGYHSVAEMKADMSDPRYGSDEAFDRYVQNKIRQTTIF